MINLGNSMQEGKIFENPLASSEVTVTEKVTAPGTSEIFMSQTNSFVSTIYMEMVTNTVG